jgi:5-methylthioribose kinase
MPFENYEVLDTKSIISYLASRQAGIYGLLDDTDSQSEINQITVKSVSDGNLNNVFWLSNNDKHLIIKQSLPFVRSMGEGVQLSKDRMLYEISALKAFSKFVPLHIPKIYHTDETMCVVVMQCLDKHQVMRTGMMQGIQYPNFAEHISTYLAQTLFNTSSLCLSSTDKAKLMTQFNGNGLRELTENLVFTFPYQKHASNHILPTLVEEVSELHADHKFIQNVLRLKDSFMNKAEALIHADLHTGSIMLNQNEFYVIDAEFAFVGPLGFDVGVVLANLILSWASHFHRSDGNNYRAWIFETIQNFLKAFDRKFTNLWDTNLDQRAISKDLFNGRPLIENGFLSPHELGLYQRQHMLAVLQEAIGFAGCEMTRRLIGFAGVADIRDIKDEIAQAQAIRMALAVAKDFVVNYSQFYYTHDIIKILQNAAKIYCPEASVQDSLNNSNITNAVKLVTNGLGLLSKTHKIIRLAKDDENQEQKKLGYS